MSPNWIVNKKATINPKNEKDNKCFQLSIISGLNYNKIKKTYLKKIENLKTVKQAFYHTKETRKVLSKAIHQLLLMSYLYHTTVKK